MNHRLVLITLTLMIFIASTSAATANRTALQEGQKKAMLSLQMLAIAEEARQDKLLNLNSDSDNQFSRYKRDEISDYEGWEN